MPKSLRFFVVFCFAIFLTTRIRFYAEPFERDWSTYFLIAKEWLKGRELYVDLWDNKPPGIFWVVAPFLKISQNPYLCTFIFNIFFSMLSIVGAGVSGSILKGMRGAWIAASAMALLLCSSTLFANQPNTELVMNALLVWSYPGWIWAYRVSATQRLPRLLYLSALLVGMAAVIKHVAVVFGALLLGGILLRSRQGARIAGRRLAELALAGFLTVLPWLLCFAAFYLRGSSEILWLSVVDFSRQYAGNPWLNLFRGFGEFRYLFPDYMIPLWGASTLAAGVMVYLFKIRSDFRYCALALLLGNICMIVLPGRFFNHYCQLHLPWLALIAIYATETRRLKGLALFGFFVFVGLQAKPWMGSAEEMSRSKYGELFVAVDKVAPELKAKGVQEKGFYLWGVDPSLYILSGAVPRPGVLWCDHVSAASALTKIFENRVENDLQVYAPEWVLLDCAACNCGPDGRPMSYILSHYREEAVANPGRWRWLRRR